MLKQLFRSLRSSPAVSHNEAAIALWHQGDLAGAERALRAAVAADPGFAPAYGNLGMVVWEQRRLEEGLGILRRAVELDPRHVGVRTNLANALVVGNRMEEGVAHYREVLRLAPDHGRALANILKPLLDLCDWEEAESLVARLVERWRENPGPAVLDSVTPFASLSVDVPQAMRLDVARRTSQRIAERMANVPRPVRTRDDRPQRLRIGYASADLHNHATAHLAAGLFEHHDRERFEVFAYSFGIDDRSEYRRRTAAAFEHFVDIRDLPFREAAARIAADGIDVLVDLKGHTGDSRPEIFALRPAPLQVSYLGYPGTMGADFIDYLVADRVVVPEDQARWYSERIAWMPASYQVNDDRQPIAERTPSRAEFGLPDAAFVFCSFNKHYKIDRRMFEVWLRILAAVEGSVLWLIGGHGEPALKARAAKAGVDPARLVFAGKLPKPEHLARHRCADLFLDTRTYNAHTTASDALWAALPVLTSPGEGFASRVGASLVRAVGLPELAVPTLAEYEREAIALARSPARLAELRARLAASRATAPLFRTAAFTRDIEDVYTRMWERHVSGRPPESFPV